jgi:hypothetical protein
MDNGVRVTDKRGQPKPPRVDPPVSGGLNESQLGLMLHALVARRARRLRAEELEEARQAGARGDLLVAIPDGVGGISLVVLPEAEAEERLAAARAAAKARQEEAARG